MSDDEVFVLFVGIALAVAGVALHSTSALHPLFFRGNPAPGIVRASLLLAMAWISFVLWRFADPSVTGIYVLFYLVLGFAAVKMGGQSMALVWVSTKRDVAERQNVAAAILVAGFVVATGLIFGGSLWGEADPVGDDEGGWWIPVTFFLLGWAVLLLAFALYRRREPAPLARRVRQERRVDDARAAAAFLISAAVPLTEAVAGDFWGWRHGLLSFGAIAVLLLAHEVFASWRRSEPSDAGDETLDPRRLLESLLYLAVGAGVWFVHRTIDRLWGGG
jgi:hypothetical protein